MLPCGNLRAMTIGELQSLKRVNPFTLSLKFIVYSHHQRVYLIMIAFRRTSQCSHEIHRNRILFHEHPNYPIYFKHHFTIFFAKKKRKTPEKNAHLVADVVGFRLNPRPQGGDFDARHGRAQGLDAFLDGVGHQLVAGFREGHLHVNWSWSPKSEGNSEGNV